MRTRALQSICLLFCITLDAAAADPFLWSEAREEKHGGVQVKYARNLNGQEVPVEKTEEIVIESSANSRIIERITTKFDPNGRPGQPEKTRIEQTRSGDTEREVATTTRRDANGNAYTAEVRRTTNTRSGDNVSGRTEIERGLPGGNLQLAQIDEVRTTRPSADTSLQNTTTYARDINGRFGETARKTSEARKAQTGEVTITDVEWSSVGGGNVALVKQEVHHIRGNHTEIDVYEPSAPGRVSDGHAKLVRRRIVDVSTTGSETVETSTVQTVDENGRLGAPRPAGRRVCTGECR